MSLDELARHIRFGTSFKDKELSKQLSSMINLDIFKKRGLMWKREYSLGIIGRLNPILIFAMNLSPLPLM